jgi:hypothetical protein
MAKALSIPLSTVFIAKFEGIVQATVLETWLELGTPVTAYFLTRH